MSLDNRSQRRESAQDIVTPTHKLPRALLEEYLALPQPKQPYHPVHLTLRYGVTSHIAAAAYIGLTLEEYETLHERHLLTLLNSPSTNPPPLEVSDLVSDHPTSDPDFDATVFSTDPNSVLSLEPAREATHSPDADRYEPISDHGSDSTGEGPRAQAQYERDKEPIGQEYAQRRSYDQWFTYYTDDLRTPPRDEENKDWDPSTLPQEAQPEDSADPPQSVLDSKPPDYWQTKAKQEANNLRMGRIYRGEDPSGSDDGYCRRCGRSCPGTLCDRCQELQSGKL